MQREILITADGSTTIHMPEWNEQYHSKHGAIQEAYHVFIQSGLDQLKSLEKISILEIGFGTGLNAFITFLESKKSKQHVDYVGIEAYPVKGDEVSQLNYVTQLNAESDRTVFDAFHSLSWFEKHSIFENFTLTKRQRFFDEIEDVDCHNLIYFDAFGARVQPELWTEAIFKIMFKALKEDGILVTYSAKGSVRRAMQEVGFTIEKIPGPPGKREMLRGVKKA